jgi:hypothetical protein
MMLTKENLKKLVEDIVPSPYKPGEAFASVKKSPYVTNIEYIDKDNISRWVKNDGGDQDATNIQAVAMNWGVMKRRAQIPTWKESKLSYGIWLSKELDVPVMTLAFIILHEIGHVDWAVRRGELINWKEEHQESYADMYAYERLGELYGEHTAVTTLNRCASAHGLGASEENKCQTS